MDTDRWERLCALVESASAAPLAERAAFIARAAAGDSALAAEARAMLEAESRAGDFLQPPASGAAAAAAPGVPALAPGARVGRYLLREVLASGGMGTVFLAEQDAPRRTVSL
jgi:serine/threonine-protein kinase